jgi:ribosomal protein S6
MKVYELTYIISPEISAGEAEAKAKDIDTFLQSKEGVIIRAENPALKTLSYPIKKQSSGFFGVLEFQIEPEKLNEVKEKLEKDSKILRHIIIIKKPVKEQKERRTRKPLPTREVKIAIKESSFAKKDWEAKPEKKVELKEIEKKLDEILGE